MTNQPFPAPTQEQKKKLALLNESLGCKGFNIFLLLQRFNKVKGYFPPIPLTIEIAKACIKADPVSKWAFFASQYKKAMPSKFGELEIAEHDKVRNLPPDMELLGEIFSRAKKTGGRR